MDPIKYLDKVLTDLSNLSPDSLKVILEIVKERDVLRERVTELENCLRTLEKYLAVLPSSGIGSDSHLTAYDLRRLVQQALKGDSK